jgi:hypothetical protein
MKSSLIGFTLGILAFSAHSQGVDAEFEQYKTPDGINKHFFKGSVDSVFFQRRAIYERECAVSEFTSWGSFVYYLAPVESFLLAESLKSGTASMSTPSKVSLGAFVTAFYVLPPVGHLFFIHGTNGMRRLYTEHNKEAPLTTRGRLYYFSGMAMRFLLPLAFVYASSLEYDYGDMAPFLAYPLMWAGPALQWHGMQLIDDERMFLSGGLDEVKVSPAWGLRLDPENGKPAVYAGLGLAF